jgi:hypothetical protein
VCCFGPLLLFHNTDAKKGEFAPPIRLFRAQFSCGGPICPLVETVTKGWLTFEKPIWHRARVITDGRLITGMRRSPHLPTTPASAVLCGTFD